MYMYVRFQFFFFSLKVLGLNVDGFDQRNEWDEIATETRTTISELNDLVRQCDEMQQNISGENSCWSTTDQKIMSKLQEFDDVIRLHDYLLLIKRINQIRYCSCVYDRCTVCTIMSIEM